MNSLRFITLFLSIIICSSLVSHSGGLVSAKITDGWVKRDQELIFGFQINLEKDWKTYWRLPGKTGLRPTFNFNSSENAYYYVRVVANKSCQWSHNLCLQNPEYCEADSDASIPKVIQERAWTSPIWLETT